MDKREWKSGPAPHVGWWNASKTKDVNCWRWWDGAQWSYSALANNTAEYAALSARSIAPEQHKIEWTDYYPTDARVPRVDPTQPSVQWRDALAKHMEGIDPTEHVINPLYLAKHEEAHAKELALELANEREAHNALKVAHLELVARYNQRLFDNKVHVRSDSFAAMVLAEHQLGLCLLEQGE